jgi:2-polyprenyl-3-methyl-5-hydroxy-6-metoxy-1,4-benzoquinol methylase
MKKADFSSHCIKDAPVTSRLLEILTDAGYRGAGLTNNAYARSDRFFREFAPRIAEVITFNDRPVVEIGCGVGSVTHAFANLFRQVDAFEISSQAASLARRRVELFNLTNCRIHVSQPNQLIEEALGHLQPNSVIFLYAVLEHMTEYERLHALKMIWEELGPDNYVYVGNTPNRFSWFDNHTHEQPFLLSLPDHTFRRYLELHKDIRFSERLLLEYRNGGEEAFKVYRARRGLGISFHDFEIGFGGADLNECVVLADIGSPREVYDALLHAYFLDAPIDVPLCFALRDMNFLLKKPGHKEKSMNRQHNSDVRLDRAVVVRDVLHRLCNRLEGAHGLIIR